MNHKTDHNNLSAAELAKGKNVRLWYWPHLEKPFVVQTRRPGRPYRFHSAHNTEAEAAVEFRLVTAGGQHA